MNCLISVKGKSFVIDLICLPLIGIDIIIGIDWLSSNDIILNCSIKLAYFSNDPPKEQKSFKSLLLNATQVEKCLLEGAQGFVLYYLNSEVELEMDSIPIMREFPEVFPKDIVNLPLERKVEFSIDFIPGT